jgi:hypothetical protein
MSRKATEGAATGAKDPFWNPKHERMPREDLDRLKLHKLREM